MTGKAQSPRRSVLDLAPLELDCMNILWPLGEGTVRQIRDQLASRRPRAYTTIMTIMDRLARKGVVERRKFGRAYIYRPNLSAEQARTQALGQVVENFFGGSPEALIRQLSHTMIPRSTSPALSAAAAVGAAPSLSLASLSATRPLAAVLTMPSQQSAQESPSSRPPQSPLNSPPADSASLRQSAEADADSIDDTLL
jgi:BlaI family transcriptional regulator, penicillinase repressor